MKMKNLLKFFSIFSFATLAPFTAFAATGACDALTGIGNLICTTQQILNSIVPILVALGIVYFVWGVVQYVIAGGEEAKKKGRDQVVYGIIGLTVIVGLNGLINIVVNTFHLGGQNIAVPALVPLASGTGSASCSALAANPKLQDFLHYFTCIINDSIIPLIFSVAIVVFIWGAVKFFIIGAEEEKKRQEGKQFMIWGIIALAVMLSVWGLVHILTVTFGVVGTGASVLPQVHP